MYREIGMLNNGLKQRQNLEQDGYCVAKRRLPEHLIAALRADAGAILPQINAEHRERNRSQGSLVQLADYPSFAKIIGASEIRAVLKELQFPDPRFSSGYLISKPAHSPALFWHQDWWAWDDPISYTAEIAQVFVMIYLTNTTENNGCIRVIPGSHRNRHPLHASLQAHDERLSRVVDPSHPLYQSHPDAISIPVSVGDILIGDARLLHSTFPNNSDQDRSLLTLWYHPNFENLPASMQATIRKIYDRTVGDTDPAGPDATTIDDWPDNNRGLVADLIVPEVGGALARDWNRVPHWPAAED